MPRLLIIAHHRPDRSPSQRFRFEQYIDWLATQGWQCELSPLLTAADDRSFYAHGRWLGKLGVLLRATARRLRDVWRARHFDAVLVQREAHMLGWPFVEMLIAMRGVPMLFDFDDAIWLPNVSEGNRALAFLKSPDKTGRIIARCQLIIAGNDYLADYARRFNRNVAVIPTTIDTDEYQPGMPHADDQPVVIGWSGSITTIQHFELALPALRQIRARYGERVRFEVVGDGNFSVPELGIVGKPWRKDTELDDLRAFDIGIMPLPDEAWARGKCGLKGLQYMALSIATVMSPVGVNSTIIQSGENGCLAEGEAQWVEVLSRLVDDAALRRRLGSAGRDTVLRHYSVLANGEKYLAALRRVTSPSHSS